MTSVLFIRHGLTQWNLDRRIQGLRQTALHPQGRRLLQKRRLPAAWRDAQVFVSPLRRCRETARALGIRRARTSPALREMDWGEWEGRLLAELREELGNEFQANEARGLDFRPTGGESPRQVRKRLRRWLARQAGDSRPVVAITHKGVIRAALSLATGWQMQDKPPLSLNWHCAHEFTFGRSGRLYLRRANIELPGHGHSSSTATERPR